MAASLERRRQRNKRGNRKAVKKGHKKES